MKIMESTNKIIMAKAKHVLQHINIDFVTKNFFFK